VSLCLLSLVFLRGVIRRVLGWLRVFPASVRYTDMTLVAVPARAGVGDGGVDFFPVVCVVTLRGINVVFVLQVAGWSVHLLGAMRNPDGWWTAQ
jgi:hypothetical protein